MSMCWYIEDCPVCKYFLKEFSTSWGSSNYFCKRQIAPINSIPYIRDHIEKGSYRSLKRYNGNYYLHCSQAFYTYECIRSSNKIYRTPILNRFEFLDI
ncbi:hypothetical protein LCGC14_1451410 [marine sediment metagenome]|uniref:Uncharacterized protein n=1 Tax=marine sediment metagenome TaxID=412755 RepID=A0A0F9K436_9ZZZZ